MTPTAIAGIVALSVGVGTWLHRADRRAEQAAKHLGFDPEHQRQVALGVTDLRDHVHKADLHLVEPDGTDDDITEAVARVLNLPRPDGGAA